MIDENSYFMIYTGHGKGKTTAALGMVFRALGRDLKVAVVQFVKGKWMTGERKFAEGLKNLEFHVMGLGFTWESDDISKDKEAARRAWETSKECILSGKHSLVVLDEITYAIGYGFIDEDDVRAVIADRPQGVSVCITGRNATEALMEQADLVTVMEPKKHPYKKGRKAIVGIDY